MSEDVHNYHFFLIKKKKNSLTHLMRKTRRRQRDEKIKKLWENLDEEKNGLKYKPKEMEEGEGEGTCGSRSGRRNLSGNSDEMRVYDDRANAMVIIGVGDGTNLNYNSLLILEHDFPFSFLTFEKVWKKNLFCCNAGKKFDSRANINLAKKITQHFIFYPPPPPYSLYLNFEEIFFFFLSIFHTTFATFEKVRMRFKNKELSESRGRI